VIWNRRDWIGRGQTSYFPRNAGVA
jgi:hypothetical protein